MRYVNFPDLLLIGLASYAVVWALNGLLRHAGGNTYQA